jgi:hypothetical protein
MLASLPPPPPPPPYSVGFDISQTQAIFVRIVDQQCFKKKYTIFKSKFDLKIKYVQQLCVLIY